MRVEPSRNNAAQIIDSTCIRVIVYLNGRRLVPGACILGLYCNKVIQQVACQNHTQHPKVIIMSLKISGIPVSQNPIRIFLVIIR
jgi:hypothetical protein